MFFENNSMILFSWRVFVCLVCDGRGDEGRDRKERLEKKKEKENVAYVEKRGER